MLVLWHEISYFIDVIIHLDTPQDHRNLWSGVARPKIAMILGLITHL